MPLVGDGFLSGGLRLQLRRILPRSVFTRRRAAVDVARFDLQERVLAQVVR